MDYTYRGNFRINKAVIIFHVEFSDIQVAQDIEDILDKSLLLAKIFCRKGRPMDLLKENYLTETEEETKEKLLNTLYSLKEDFSPDDAVVKKALHDLSAGVRFSGVRLLRKKGYDYLKKLYENENLHIKKRIITYLKTEREACFLDYFLDNAEHESSTAIKKELVDYFRIIGDVKAEPFLRNELDRKRDYEGKPDFLSYKQAVIQALKYCGTYESIEPLYRIKQFTLKRAADEAIAMIQDRIGSGDKGWLSISPGTDDGGKLSLTDEQEESG
jgi:hypothetical protein